MLLLDSVRPLTALWIVATLVAVGPACKGDEPEVATGEKDEHDAAPAPTPSEPVDGAPHVTSTGEYHLDDDPIDDDTVARARPRRRPTRPIEIILRSSPPGATAAVDGQPVGKTPTYWAGTADGRPHEFTFSMPGYGLARYRFVATRDGIVHGSLRRLVQADDAGAESP